MSSDASMSVGFCKATSIRKTTALHNQPLLCLHILSEPPSVETSTHRDAPPTSPIVFSQGSIIAATHTMQSAHFLTGVRLALSARQTRPACYSGWNVTDHVSSMSPMRLENWTLRIGQSHWDYPEVMGEFSWSGKRFWLSCNVRHQAWGRKDCWKKKEEYMINGDNLIRREFKWEGWQGRKIERNMR